MESTNNVESAISMPEETLESLNKSFKDTCGKTLESLNNSCLHLFSTLKVKLMLFEGDQLVDIILPANLKVRVVSVNINDGTATISIQHAQIPVHKIIVQLLDLAVSIK